MVTIRPEAELRANFPDDMIEDDDGEIVEFGGRGVTEAITGMLVHLGYEVSPPEYAGEHGWEFQARANGLRFWLQISQIEGSTYSLMTENMTRRLWPDRRQHGEFLVELDSAIRRDGRFGQVQWLKKNWKLKEGSDSPVEE